MRITKFVTFAIACVVLFSACNKDEFDGVETPSIIDGEGQISLVLTDSTIPADTRSVSQGADDEGDPKESKINVVEFYVFNGENPDTKTPYIKYDNNASRFTFDVDANNNKTVLAAINMELGAMPNKTLNDVKEAMYDKVIPTSERVGVYSSNIPMSGEYKDLTVADGDVETIVLEVARLYARFNAPKANNPAVNLKNDREKELLAELLPDTDISNVKFRLNGHVVINGLKKSYAFPNYGVATEKADRWNKNVWEIGNVRANYTKSQYNTQGHLGTVYSGDDFLINNESVYLYENCPVYVDASEAGTTSSGYRASSVYSFIIEGDLYDSTDTNKKATRYWRINVSRTDDEENIFKILRNAIYNVNIQNVTTVGYETPEESEDDDEDDDNGGGIIPGTKNAAIEVEVKVASWRVFNEDSDI